MDLKNTFPEYSGGLDYEAGILFIANKFKGLRKDQTRKTYLHVTTATNTDSVNTVLLDVFDILEKDKSNAML